ncbi:MAG: DinB family protein [Planctomycetota bacterium]
MTTAYPPAEALLRLHALQGAYFEQLVGAIPAEHACAMPAGFGSHAAWQVGHIAFVGEVPAKMLTGEPSILPENFSALFGKGSEPNPDATAYPAFIDLVESARAGRAATAEALRAAVEQDFARPNPREHFIQRGLPTLGDMVGFMVATHEGMHLGQLAAWRRAMGFGPVM